MDKKKHVELENAEMFYEKAKENAHKLEILQADIDKFSNAEAEDVTRRDLWVESLEMGKEKYEYEKELAEDNIRSSIKLYLDDTEKEQKKLIKNRDNYEKYIQEEQAKLDALKSEIDSLEGNEEQEQVLADKKEEYEELKAKIDKKIEKLKSYDEKIANLKLEIEQAKEKFKDYIVMPTNIVAEQEVQNEEKNVNEESIDITKQDPSNDENLVENNAESNVEKTEKNDTLGNVVFPKSSDVAKANAGVVAESNTQKEIDEQVDEQPKKESDEQAFNRIYGLLSKRKNKALVTSEDVDKMVEILSNKDNYEKLNIGTKRFLNLKLFPSKAEKIYKIIGEKLAYDVYKVTKNKDVLSPDSRAELSKWEDINDYGIKIDEKTNAEKALDAALTAATPDNKEQIEKVKARLEKYRNSMITLDEVMFDRGELEYVNNKLPAGKDEIVESEKESAKDLEEAPLLENIFSDLSSGVKAEPDQPLSKDDDEGKSTDKYFNFPTDI